MSRSIFILPYERTGANPDFKDREFITHYFRGSYISLLTIKRRHVSLAGLPGYEWHWRRANIRALRSQDQGRKG